MDAFEQNIADFRLWQSEMIAQPPNIRDFADKDDPDWFARSEMECLLLRTQVNEIRDVAYRLGYPKQASFHTLLRADGYTAVYVYREFPKEQATGTRYLGVLVNEVTDHNEERSTAETAQYFVDLQACGVRAYYGKAESNGGNWEISPGSPPFIYKAGMKLARMDAQNYHPELPPQPEEMTPFTIINEQRQQATVLLAVLDKLDEVSQDFPELYEA